jgi:hypothetical protein
MSALRIAGLRVAALAAFCLMAAPAAEPDQFASKFADRDVSADTNPASEFWRGIPAVYIENDARGNPVPGYRTEVRSRWTAKNLYFLFICPFEQLNLKPDPKTESETNELWKWDVAEVFLGSDFQNIRRYKEFEVSPQGEWVDLDINLDAPRHEDGWVWNSGFSPAARVDQEKKLWYVFMRIPFASVDARPAAPGGTLRINCFLTEGARPNHNSLSCTPTQKPTFHVPEAFGILQLVR